MGRAFFRCRRKRNWKNDCGDGTVGLVRLCGTITVAQKYSRALVDKHLLKLRTQRAVVLANAQRPREVTIEKWIGTASEGSWELLDRREGFYFEFLVHAPRFGNRPAPVSGAAADAPASGSPAPEGKEPAELAVVDTKIREPRSGAPSCGATWIACRVPLKMQKKRFALQNAQAVILEGVTK